MTSITVPAIVENQAGRTQYVASMRLPDIIAMIPLRDPDEWTRVGEYNRPIDKRHVTDIRDYLLTAENIVLPAMMVGANGGLEWKPSGKNAVIGRLTVDGEHIAATIDGQHRDEAFKQAFTALLERINGSDPADVAQAQARYDSLMETSCPVIFYEGEPDEYRQAYVDVDQQKRAGPETAVRFDQRNPFAVAARAIADTHPLLVAGTVEEDKRTPGTAFTSLSNIATQIAPALFGFGGRGRRTTLISVSADEVANRVSMFLDDLAASTPLGDVVEGKMSVADARETAHVLAAYTTMIPVFANIWRGVKFTTPVKNADAVREIMARLPQTVEESLAMGDASPFATFLLEPGKAPRGGAQEAREAVSAALTFVYAPPSEAEVVTARHNAVVAAEEELETTEAALQTAVRRVLKTADAAREPVMTLSE